MGPTHGGLSVLTERSSHTPSTRKWIMWDFRLENSAIRLPFRVNACIFLWLKRYEVQYSVFKSIAAFYTIGPRFLNHVSSEQPLADCSMDDLYNQKRKEQSSSWLVQNDGTKCLERLNQSGVQTAKGQIETMSDSRQSKSKYTPGGERSRDFTSHRRRGKKIRDNETVGDGRVLGQQEGIWHVLHFSAFTCLPPFQHIILVLWKFLYSARGIEYGNKTPLTQCECVIFCKIPLTNAFF